MIFEHQSYRSFLKSVLAERSQRTPGYSLRSFSQKIGISNSFLSEVLNDKKSLSVELAFKIAVKLDLTEAETQYLCLLVQLEHEKSPDFRETLFGRLKELNPRVRPHDISADLFRMVADWYHLAILELTYLPGSDLEPSYVARKLGLTVSEAEKALERLQRLGLLVNGQDGRLAKAHDFIFGHSDVPNQAFKDYHGQLLQKAFAALQTQPPKERVSNSATVAIDSKHLPTAKRLTEEYVASILRLSDLSNIKDSVYALTIHFFNLTANRERSE